MKIYIAHNLAAKDFLARVVVPALGSIGHVVISRWIKEQLPQSGESGALMDLEDIDKADAILFFADQVGNTPGRGKFFELGYAYAKKKKIYIYGVDESCIFYNLPGEVYRIVSLQAVGR